MTLTGKTLHVARWEFVERVKTKSFLIGLFLTPAIMAVFAVGPALLQDSLADADAVVVAVHDGTGVVVDSLVTEFARGPMLENGTPKYRIERIEAAGRSLARVKADIDTALLRGAISAAVVIPREALDSNIVEYRSTNVSDIESITRIERKVSDIVSAYRIAHAGLDPAKVDVLTRATSMRTVRVTETGEEESGFLESFGLSYVFLIMLMIMILSSGQMLVRSLVEEKSNRIVEILVSSCSPMDLMFGKIIGISMLGIVQVLFWSLIGILLVVAAELSNLPLDNIWLMLLYFMLGFLLYAAVFVAFGSLASTEQEAQQITGYLTMLLMLPIVIAFMATQSPNNPVLVVLTMIPLLTPQMMFMRLPITTPPAWEIALSLLILVLSIIAVTWVAGKIFRTGILLTGKRPSLDEIVRWLRS
ncbi:MAG: ABC transporter permease [Bacteroidota bacterium]|jgi:ABC-2 type transport system permease protein|nr:ABC transporter permease [Bacteroidota bacterium]